jgi:N-acetylneuraminic acid mutarotase
LVRIGRFSFWFAQEPVRGLSGEASDLYTPGGRARAMAWVDQSNNMFYLFGGTIDDKPNGNYFNDLWVYDPQDLTWAWLSGENAKVSG